MRTFNTQLFRVLEGGKSCKNTDYLSVVSISINTKIGFISDMQKSFIIKKPLFSTIVTD